MNLGERLRQVRGSKSQAAFASEIGVSQSSVRLYEQGERVPDVNYVLAVSATFGVNLQWLMTGQGESPLPRPLPEGREKADSGGKNIEMTYDVKRLNDEVMRLNQELIEVLRENAELVRENGDLRVRLALLENQNGQRKITTPRP